MGFCLFWKKKKNSVIVQRQPIFSLSHSFFSLFVCSLIRKYGATKNTKLRGQTLAPTSATMNCSSKLSLSLSLFVFYSLCCISTQWHFGYSSLISVSFCLSLLSTVQFPAKCRRSRWSPRNPACFMRSV